MDISLQEHDYFMQHALRLAARALGNSWPNPAVGCVIVKEGRIVGRGWTARGGRPHAEAVALTQAGTKAQGATLYVTLEPCAHYGKSPPCADAIIGAGIKRVVAACSDPNPLVFGKGFSRLRPGGVEVVESIRQQQAETLNEGFFSVIARQRPFIALKLATSLDGKIATATGESKWITGKGARDYGHYLRATHDAILTGSGTVMADNPSVACRLPGRAQDSPQRVILDRRLRTPPDSAILPAWIFTEQPEKTLENARLFPFSSLQAMMHTLAEQGITRLLVEAGKLSDIILKERLADKIYWFRAPLVIGEEGVSALQGKNLSLPEISRYDRMQMVKLGEDALEIYQIKT